MRLLSLAALSLTAATTAPEDSRLRGSHLKDVDDLSYCTIPEGFQVRMSPHWDYMYGISSGLRDEGILLNSSMQCDPRAIEFSLSCPSEHVSLYANNFSGYDRSLEEKIRGILNNGCEHENNVVGIVTVSIIGGSLALAGIIALAIHCNREMKKGLIQEEARKLRQLTAGAVPQYGSIASSTPTANPVLLRTPFTGLEETPIQTPLASRAYQCAVTTLTNVASSTQAGGTALMRMGSAGADGIDRTRIRASASLAGLFHVVPRYQTIGTATPGILTAASSTVTAGSSDLTDRYATRQGGEEAETSKLAL